MLGRYIPDTDIPQLLSTILMIINNQWYMGKKCEHEPTGVWLVENGTARAECKKCGCWYVTTLFECSSPSKRMRYISRYYTDLDSSVNDYSIHKRKRIKI